MFSKQNKAKILIFSPQICPRVDSNKNQNVFYRFSWNPIKIPIFELFFENHLKNWMNFMFQKKFAQNIDYNPWNERAC